MTEPANNVRAHRILIVEDDEELTLALRACLENNAYSVVSAKDGLTGRNIVGLEPFDLVISDIRMPHLSGIELLQHIRRTAGPPVILMTGFSELVETKEAYELGAIGFLSKPFRLEEFLQTVKSVLSPDPDDAPRPDQDCDDNFISLHIEEFITGKEIQYEIYLRLAADRFVKIAAGGENLAPDRIASYKAKGVQNLHLRKSDFAKYLGFTSDPGNKAPRADQIQRSKKVNALAQASMQIMKGLHVSLMDKEKLDMAAQLVETTIKVMGTHNDTLHLLEALRGHSEALFAHSVSTALISALLGRQVGWRSPRSITRLIACAILHDIGKTELPVELTQKPRVSLSAGDLRELESHSLRGKRILENVRGLPEEVYTVAMQHHENCRALGQPLGLSKSRISPLARLISVADQFCNWVYPTPGHPAKDATVAALNLQTSGFLDEEFVKALQAILCAGTNGQKAG